MLSAHIDFETASEADLKKVGLARYAIHPSTFIWMMSWRVGDDQPVQRWHPGEEDPLDLLIHVAEGGRVVAHNANFERTIWNVICRRLRPWWPVLQIGQLSCTMARALRMNLPGDLDGVADALNLRFRKDAEGAVLMRKMMKPRKARKGEPPGTYWNDGAVNIARLGDYCDLDVETETAADQALPELDERERRVWELDQTINDRGVRLDLAMAERALAVVEIARARADRRLWELTSGACTKASEVAKLVTWINGQGVTCSTLQKGEHEDLILLAGTEGAPLVPEAIEIRREASKASTSKLKAMLLSCVDGDRSHNSLQYYGAKATGRWSGRLWQPQNLPRVDEETEAERIALIRLCLMDADTAEEGFDLIESLVGPAMPWISKALRSHVIAEQGNKLIGADYSNIEGRLSAWLSREEWKLEAFRAYDAKTGPDLYNLAYSNAFGVPVSSVSGVMRQIGKVMELALGYQGSVGAFIGMAANYFVKAITIARVVNKAVSPELWAKTATGYAKAIKYGLTEFEWTGIKIVVDGWRGANPNTVQCWWDVQDAAIEAVASPGTIVPVCGGLVRYMVTRGMLFCSLPSGRLIDYAEPRLVKVDEETPIYDEDGELIEIRVKSKWQVSAGIRPRKWLYGGLQWNNITQGNARDVLVDGMFRVEDAGYPIVLTVHDENISEVAKEFGSVEEYQRLMSIKSAWLTDMPLSVKAWEGERF